MKTHSYKHLLSASLFLGLLALLSWKAVSQNSNQYVIIDENFDTGYNPKGWLLIDADQDKSRWNSGQMVGEPAYAHSGEYVMFSLSQDPSEGKALKPDNWMILPALRLRAQATLTYYVMAGDKDKVAEHYAIVASKTGTELKDFTEILFDETMTDAKTSSLRQQSTPTAWQKRTVTIPASTKYIAFRHYNCSGQFYLAIDDVKITSSSAPIVASASLQILGKSYDTSIDNPDMLGNGTVSYDARTKTLLLKNAKLESSNDVHGIEMDHGELTLRLEGYNEITLASSESVGIRLGENGKMTITGSGELEVANFDKPAIGLDSKSHLTVRKTKLNLSGGLGGIIGAYGTHQETLVLDRAEIFASGDLSAVGSLHNFTMLQSKIANPSGAVFKQGKLSAEDNEAWGVFDGEDPVTSCEIAPDLHPEQLHSLTVETNDLGEVWASTYTPAEYPEISEGSRVEIVALPKNPAEVVLLSLTANGKDILADMAFTMGQENVVVKAEFGKPESIGELSDSRIRIYPNPARSQFFVEGCAPGEIVRLINAAGQIVDTFRTDASGQASLHVDSFVRGLYILQVGQTFHRVILE